MKAIIALLLVGLMVSVSALPNRAEAEKLREALLEQEKTMGIAKRAGGSGDEDCVSTTVTLWTSGNVPYFFCPDFTDEAAKAKVRSAVADLNYIFDGSVTIEEVDGPGSCAPDSADSNMIGVKSTEQGCWSYIGMISTKPQILNLQAGSCKSSGVIKHEFLHALGEYHMQQYPGRDDSIVVNENNIQPDKVAQFKINSHLCQNCEYQTCSIMHYSPTSFNVGGKKTIEAKDASFEPDMGKKTGVSPFDVCQTSSLYPANGEGCPSSTCDFGTGEHFDFSCCHCKLDKELYLSGDSCSQFDETNSTSGGIKKVHYVLNNNDVAYIASPNYPGNYKVNEQYVYFVEAPAGRNLDVLFERFVIEADKTCYWDQFAYTADYSVLDCQHTLCGDHSGKSFQTRGNFFWAMFNSDDMYTENGFLIKFTVV